MPLRWILTNQSRHAQGRHFAAFTFDNSGRLIREKDFHGRESTISYNANERTTTVTRPDSTTVKTLKDTQGRIRSVVSSGEVSRTRNFTYRNDGKLMNYAVNFAGDINTNWCDRNSLGELNTKNGAYNIGNNNAVQYNVSYSRDDGGLVNSLNFGTWSGMPNDSGTTRTFTRDEMGRISRVQAGDVDISYTYNNDGRISSIQYPNFYNKSFTYDNSGRLTQSDYRAAYPYLPGSVTINNQYDPYAAARLKQQQLTFDNGSNYVHNYDYDIIDQITEETLVIGNQFGYNNSENISYLYNGFGDRTGVVANVTNISNVATIDYPDANTITKITGSLTKTFFSDDRGNLILITDNGLPITAFSYDSDNNMIGAEANGTNWTFCYNADNQLYYSKIVDEYDSVIDERFYIYDGLDCIAETDTDGTILREYIRVGNVGGIVAEIRHNDSTCAPGYESGTYYYHYNHRGDVIAVSDFAGNLIFKADYDAYGKITRLDSGTFEPRYTFSTKRYFSELGLYYYGYRWYIPELGRWTTKDPISHLSGELNLYNFCVNNPLCFGDSYGLASIVETARSNLGSTKWNYDKHYNWRYRKRDYKCNVFTGDMIIQSGLPDPKVDGMIGKRYPSASAWADPDVDIPGWSKPHNNPQPGDVGSDTEHMGINTGDGTTISASSIENKVVENDWGFREIKKGGRPVVWRSPCK